MHGRPSLRWLPLVLLLAIGSAPATDEAFTPFVGTAGTFVTITGHGFVPVRKPKVDFLVSPAGQEGLSDAKAKVRSFSDAGIVVEAPRLRPGTYAIRVTPHAGEGLPVTLPGSFMAVNPVVTSVDADSIAAGSTFTVHGTFGDRKGKLFVGKKKAKVLTWSNLTITAAVPPRLPDDPQSIVVKNADGASPGDMVLEAGGGLPKPALGITFLPVEIQLPQNCQRFFKIFNDGPPGSVLQYQVADDGALSGFLSVTNASGSLSAGSEVLVGVSVLPDFVNADPTLAGDDLVLNVYTPGASNFLKYPVLVKVRSAAMVAQGLVGVWSGTWSGTSVGPNNPMEAAPQTAVSGSWTLVVDAVDLDIGGISGSLGWTGTDAYWTYTRDAQWLFQDVTPVVFTPDRTVFFGLNKASVQVAGNLCRRFTVKVDGSKGEANPSDAFYGPNISIDLDLDTNAVVSPTTFATRPYAPTTFETWVSLGGLAGGR